MYFSRILLTRALVFLENLEPFQELVLVIIAQLSPSGKRHTSALVPEYEPVLVHPFAGSVSFHPSEYVYGSNQQVISRTLSREIMSGRLELSPSMAAVRRHRSDADAVQAPAPDKARMSFLS